jgi:hypothetical protein
MAQKRLASVDLVLFGVQRTFDFSDEPVELDIELPDGELDAEIAAGREVLSHVESLEVQLVDAGPASASVRVSFSIQWDSEVEVDLDDLEGLQDEDAIRDAVESGDFYPVFDAIEEELRNIDTDSVRIDNVDVSLFDEDGNDYET